MGRFCSWRLVFFGDKSRLVSRLFFGEKIGIIALSPTFGEAISGETISGSKTNRSKSGLNPRTNSIIKNIIKDP